MPTPPIPQSPRRPTPQRLIFLLCLGLFVLAIGISLGVAKWEGRAAAEYLALQGAHAPAQTSPLAGQTGDEMPAFPALEDLQRINPQAVGWIHLPGAGIDYPIVQGEDNAYYLTHTFQHTKNPSGAIFLDAANAGDGTDRHVLIYGHNMEDGSMFHALNRYLEPAFAAEHPSLWLMLGEERLQLTLLSVRVASIHSGLRRLDFPGEESFAAYQEALYQQSRVPLPTPPASGDLLITLMTCTREDEEQRLLIHAVPVGKGAKSDRRD